MKTAYNAKLSSQFAIYFSDYTTNKNMLINTGKRRTDIVLPECSNTCNESNQSAQKALCEYGCHTETETNTHSNARTHARSASSLSLPCGCIKQHCSEPDNQRHMGLQRKVIITGKQRLRGLPLSDAFGHHPPATPPPADC